jgi:ethanolamine ammonia-lyase small subunit
MDNKDLTDLIRRVVEKELGGAPEPKPEAGPPLEPAPRTRADDGVPPEKLQLARKAANWLGAELPPLPWFGSWRPTGDVRHYLSKTPARLGVGKAGFRFRTSTVLSFLTDHAAAKDAVQSDMDAGMFEELGVVPLISAAADKQQFLARPDLGRSLSPESADTVRQKGVKGPQVQLVVGDGLSSTAINVNLKRILPVVEAELKRQGVRLGTTFGISNSRVAAGDEVARLVEAEVLCMIVGERPGLKTAESMGAYVTYMKVPRLNEAMRFMISNIHAGGLPPATEGARQIVDLCLKALRDKKTGVDMS